MMHTNLVFQFKGPYTLTSFLVPVAGASQLSPVNWRVCHTRISLVPVTGTHIARMFYSSAGNWHQKLTGYWYQKTGQCVWPFSYEFLTTWNCEEIIMQHGAESFVQEPYIEYTVYHQTVLLRRDTQVDIREQTLMRRKLNTQQKMG